MAYFVGIDSGGTKTECWLGDETRVLGRAQGGSVKLTRVPEGVAEERLGSLLAEVSQSSGVPLSAVRATCAGMSGYSIARLRSWMEHTLGGHVAGTVEVCGDELIITRTLPSMVVRGIMVIAGTGSIVQGRCADGSRFTAGGWGPLIGDEGSGAWIGAEGLRAGLAARDRGVTTGLLEAVRQAWGAADLAEVLGIAHTYPGPDYAALTPYVLHLAEAGDKIAEEVLIRGGKALGDQVMAVWKSMRSHGEVRIDVACTGSVLEHVARLRESLIQELEGNLSLMSGTVRAAEGALWRARRDLFAG